MTVGLNILARGAEPGMRIMPSGSGDCLVMVGISPSMEKI
jgi:hypothetical protein